MKNEIEKSNFVKPYYIAELGCEGLWSEDVANSLKTNGTDVRRKLNKRGFLSKLEACGLRCMTVMKSNSNGLRYTDYALDVNAAKFFVAKYDNESSWSYFNFLANKGREVSRETRETPKYIKPYHIVELGKEGLWASDIADSLLVNVGHIREKLGKGDFIERVQSQGFNFVVTKKNNNNGLEYTDYALDTGASKIFVAKYDNDIGFGYLSYLIKCEEVVEKLESLTPEELLLKQCQMLVDQRKRLDKVESKVEFINNRQEVIEGRQHTIIKRQEAVKDAWLDYPVPEKKVAERSTRSLINDMIRSYCKVHELDNGYSVIYKKIYAIFKAIHKIDLPTRARNESVRTGRKISTLEYTEREGLIQDLYDIAYEYCSPSRAEEKGDNLYLFDSYRD